MFFKLFPELLFSCKKASFFSLIISTILLGPKQVLITNFSLNNMIELIFLIAVSLIGLFSMIIELFSFDVLIAIKL